MQKECYFCKSNKFKEFKLADKPGRFFECKNCSLIILSKENVPQDQKEHYSSVYYDENYSGRKNIEEAFYYRLPIIEKFINKGEKILEVGAASGDFLNVLKLSDFDAYGVELSSRAVEKAKENYGILIQEGTLETSNFKDNDFKAIVMYHVLEHVEDPRKLLRETYKKIERGGFVIIEVPNPNSIDAWSRKLLGSILDYPHHIYAFPPRVLKSILRETGFEITYEQKSFSYLIASAVRKITLYFKKKNLSRGPSSINVTNNPIGTKEQSFVKRLLSIILPGMKYTVVARKIN